MLKSGGAWLAAAAAFATGANAVVRGVNLGGWLVLEPWMTPSIFNVSGTSYDSEWALCNGLGKQKCLSTLQNHWSTFYTRDDIKQIQAAGLNSIRIPLGYWAVDLLDFEPYVSGQYQYLSQAVQWAKEFDLTVMIDIHGAPGSQNGWEETGIVGGIEFPLNQSNTDRTLNVLKNLTEEFTKEMYGGAVTNIELMNEPIFELAKLQTFYTAGAEVVSVANSSGINTTFHDAFYNPPNWKNYDPLNMNSGSNGKYLTLDTHQFWAFPPLDTLSVPDILGRICAFGLELKQLDTGILPTIVGEWSLSTGHTANSTTDSGQDRDKRTWFRELFEAQNAAYTPNGPGQSSIGWYFWSWKTEYDIDAWSYRKGVEQGYIPSNISDPSTYAYPITTDGTGCIDGSFNWQAPEIAQASSSATSSAGSKPTSTGTGTSGSASAASTTASGAVNVSPASGVSAALVIALAYLVCSL
nr:hypothetical protein B0A51_16456 [Rachicladosporium sp. CCFEE 5018]